MHPARAWAFALSVVVLVLPGWARADELSLEGAVQRALKTHERAKVAALDVEIAEANVESARSDFLPSLTLGAQATVAPDPDGRYVTGNGTLTLHQPILNPSAIPRLDSAKHTLKAQKLSSSEERRTLAFDTARAFLDALSAERVLDAAKARVKRAEADLEYSKARAGAELNSVNDVTRAKLALVSAARDVSQRERDLELARINLETLVGGSIPGTLSSPEGLFADAERFTGDPSKLAARASVSRGDVLALQEQTLAARELAREPLFRLVPTIDLTGILRVNPDPLPNDTWHDESLALGLTWTIFDGGARYADRKTAVAKAKEAELQKSLAVRTMTSEVRSAFAGLESSRKSYALAKEATAAARTNTEETRVLYQQGLAKAIELVDANSTQFDAEAEMTSSRIEMAKSYLDVRQALGLQPSGGGRGS